MSFLKFDNFECNYKIFCNENLKYGIFNLVFWPHSLKMFILHKHILTPVVLDMTFPWPIGIFHNILRNADYFITVSHVNS